MPPITKSPTREIIDDFAAEIQKKRTSTAKPAFAVIKFRNEHVNGHEREVYEVPLEVLRFRKENGRIASDVEDHEWNVGHLLERESETQAILRKFLEEKDPEKTDVLRKLIHHSGQEEPAIITCDGFLINGNRRKMVIESLRAQYPEKDEYNTMKVVVLPGPDDPGGPPTLKEIEKLENRYQLQGDGKSEYYGFDRALSIRRKEARGLSLEEQIRDDPQYGEATPAEIKKAVRAAKKDFLEPLNCVDRYLRQFGREGLYRTISLGPSDKKGRWQAFIDYSNTRSRDFMNAKKRLALGVEEEEIGDLEAAAFNIIRLRGLEDVEKKVHEVMRSFGKYSGTPEGKKSLVAIATKVEPRLPESECKDENGAPLDRAEVDRKWAAKSKRHIIYNLKKAIGSHERRKEKETALTLLDAAFKKLTHEDMDLGKIGVSDLPKAQKLVSKIQRKASDLDSEIYHHQKNYRKLKK